MNIEAKINEVSVIDASVSERVELINQTLLEVNETLHSFANGKAIGEETEKKLELVSSLLNLNQIDLNRINIILDELDELDEGEDEGEEWKK